VINIIPPEVQLLQVSPAFWGFRQHDRRSAPARRHSFDRAIMPISFALAWAILAVVAFTLWQARHYARTQAVRYGQSLVQALQNDISRNVELRDLALQDLSDALTNEAP
jgi:hypothetical protein